MIFNFKSMSRSGMAKSTGRASGATMIDQINIVAGCKLRCTPLGRSVSSIDWVGRKVMDDSGYGAGCC